MNLAALIAKLIEIANDEGSMRNYPVQILTEEGDVFDVVDTEFDEDADTTYIKCILV